MQSIKDPELTPEVRVFEGYYNVIPTLLFVIAMSQDSPYDLPILKIWHLVQETIDRVGNCSYLCAEAGRRILGSARDLRFEEESLSPDKIFGGPNSLEYPGNWRNSNSFGGMEYLATIHDPVENYYHGARKDLLQKLEQVEATGGDDASMIALSSEHVPPERAKADLYEPEKLEAFGHGADSRR